MERGDRSLTLSHTFPLPLQAKMVAWTNTAGAGAGCLLLQAALNGNRSGSGVELWKFQDICGDSPHTTTRLLKLPGLGLEALRSTSLSLSCPAGLESATMLQHSVIQQLLCQREPCSDPMELCRAYAPERIR